MHPKTPRDPLASGLEAWGCPVGLWGSARAQGQASPGTPHPGDCRGPEVGDPSPGSPQLRGELPASEPCLQARGLGQSSQLRGLAALLLPGNRGRGGASRQLMGCPSQRVYTRGGTHPGTPQPPRTMGLFATGCGSSNPEFIVLLRGARRVLQGELFAASPWTGVYFALIYFPPFVDRCFWLGCSPQALFLSTGAGKGKCHPVLCTKGIINSAQLHLNLPVLTSLQS